MSTAGGECEGIVAHQVRIQVFKPSVDAWYTLDELSALWHVSRQTLMNYLAQLRKSPHAPTPQQLRRRGPNSARRYVMIRHDYVSVIRAVFRDRTLKL